MRHVHPRVLHHLRNMGHAHSRTLHHRRRHIYLRIVHQLRVVHHSRRHTRMRILRHRCLPLELWLRIALRGLPWLAMIALRSFVESKLRVVLLPLHFLLLNARMRLRFHLPHSIRRLDVRVQSILALACFGCIKRSPLLLCCFSRVRRADPSSRVLYFASA
jgi:hypothetical protein